MKSALYLYDSYMAEFEAEVTPESGGQFIVLNQTAFYPAGGGQPNDTGKLILLKDNKEYKVTYVGKLSGNISHQAENADELKPGDKVNGVIDWDRRYALMRHHTATHLLSAVFHSKTGALITGNQLDIDRSRIDFSLENFDRDKMQEYISLANDIIQKDLAVKTYFLKREDALKIPSVVKLAGAMPPQLDELRIVEIEGVDLQADGGTHVKSTSEIGRIEMLKCENKGANNRRLYFKLIYSKEHE